MSEQYGLGLLVPKVRPLRLPAIENSPFMLTRAQIEKILSDPRRTLKRKIFGKEFTKNQSTTSGCNGYAYALAVEKMRVQFGLPWVKLSGDYIYSLVNGGRDAGSMLDDGAQAAENKGIAPEDLVTRWEWRHSRMSSEAKASAINYRAWEGFRVDSEEGLASALALGWIGVVATEFNSRLMGSLDSDGISAPSNGSGNHAENVDDVTIIKGKYAFDAHNSHNIGFGEGGRHRVTWDRHLSGPNQYHAFTVFRGVRGPESGEWRVTPIEL